MVTGGNATVYVTNMDAAVRFYTETLGLKLEQRFEDHWATVRAGASLMLGLHPKSDKAPLPGTKGSIELGLEIDEAIEPMMKRMKDAGVRFMTDVVPSPNGKFAHFEDPDGNALYLWETVKAG